MDNEDVQSAGCKGDSGQLMGIQVRLGTQKKSWKGVGGGQRPVCASKCNYEMDGYREREIDKQDRRSGRLKGGQGRWAGDEKEKEGESGCVCWALVAMSVII